MQQQYQWFPGHMAKAIKEIEDRIKIIDVVLVLLDSRAPLSSLNPKLTNIIKNKPVIYVLTKNDLADNKVTNKWLSYFESENKKAIAIDVNKTNLSIIDKHARELMKEKLEREKNKGLKPRPIRYLVVGIPNVGKSTLINKLAKRKAANVANKPGVTKSQQYIRVNEKMELLDTPGVLWPNFDDNSVGIKLAMVGTIKQDILPLNDLAYQILNFLTIKYPNTLVSFYGINECIVKDDDTYLEMIKSIAKVRGYLLKGNNVDENRTITSLIKDFQAGKIVNFTLETPGEDSWQTVNMKIN